MESEIVLLDCGEGTQRQFFQSPLSFMRTRRIFITHFHGDHFLGLPGLIQSMNLNNRTEPLDIYGPRETEKFVEMVLALGYFTKKFNVVPHDVTSGKELDFGHYTVRAVRAEHPVPALAYRVQEKGKRGRFDGDKARALGCHGADFSVLERGETVTVKDGRKVTPEMVLGPPRSGRSVAYSGDSAPTEEMLLLARGVDVLIHEATTARDLEREANQWGHSSARQAAEIASEAAVGELLLTHFSSRYPDVSPLEEEARALFPNSTAAYDFFNRIIKQR